MCSLQDSLEEQTSQDSFVAHGRQDVLTIVIGRQEHPDRVRAARADVTIKQNFGPTPRTSHTSSSMAPKDKEQLTQKIMDQLEESITEKVTRQVMLSFSQMQSQFQSQIQSQVLALPPDPEDGHSATRVNTNENVVIWFCSLHNRPDNYLKGIIIRSIIFFNAFTLALVRNINILIVQYTSMFVLNNALKGFDDTPQSKSKATTR